MENYEEYSQQLADLINKELLDGSLIFPTSFDLNIRIRRMTDDPKASLRDITQLIQAEPVLSAKILKLSNSVGINPFGKRITSLNQAVQRVGIASTRFLAQVVSAEQFIHDCRSKNLKAIASQLWLHSTDLGCWSYAIATEINRIDPDTALFAGVMVDIGQFFLISRIHEFPNLELELDAINTFVQEWYMPVTRHLLEAFRVSKCIIDAQDKKVAIDSLWPIKKLEEVILLASIVTEYENPFLKDLQQFRKLVFERELDKDDVAKLKELIEYVRPIRNSLFNEVCGN